jgi:uncharacterized protein YebE (UPF0316 family)
MWESGWFVWGVLPVLIFVARIMDVSIGTMRILFVVRGSRITAALLGFMEVFIWIVVIRQIMGSHTGLLHYAAYAAGFATGNVVGISIESHLAMGLQTVRIITGEPTNALENDLLARGFGATRLAATGLRGGAMTVLFSTLPRRQVPGVLAIVEQHLPKAFVSVEDVRTTRKGHFPMREDSAHAMRVLPHERKGK